MIETSCNKRRQTCRGILFFAFSVPPVDVRTNTSINPCIIHDINVQKQLQNTFNASKIQA